MTFWFHIAFTWWLGHFTSHYLKVHFMWFKIANITHALPVAVYRQTDFTPKRVLVISHLHNTVARFHTEVKFLPGYKNWGEFTLGWLAPAWHLWWCHVNKYRAMRGNRSELAPRRKSPRCHANTPLHKLLHFSPAFPSLTFYGPPPSFVRFWDTQISSFKYLQCDCGGVCAAGGVGGGCGRKLHCLCHLLLKSTII